MAEQQKENNKDIRALVESDRFKQAVASALPAHLTPNRFVRIALTALTRTPKLNECDQQSLLSCMMQLSQFGLEPDGRLAHLIPFWNSKRNTFECQLIIDYKGLANLAMRSGKLSRVHADKVCENDEFEYNKGVVLKHKINFKEDRGKAYAYYAMVVFKDGAEKADCMTLNEVKAVRARSRAKDSGPWVTDFDEMGKKTPFRRLTKWIELSPEYRDAIDLDADALEELRFDNAKPLIKRANVPKPKLKDKDLPVDVQPEPTATVEIANGTIKGSEARESTNHTSEDGNVKSEDSRGGQDSKKKPSAKLQRKQTKSLSSPNRDAMTALLKEAGATTDQFMSIAREQDWDEGWPDNTTWDSLTEENFERFLNPESRPVVLDVLKI